MTDQNILFGSYSRGFRTGGLTQLSSDPSQPPLYTYKPEYSNNIEVGLKNTFFNNLLRANLALFYTELTDAQVPTLVLPYAITVTRNTGSLSSKGIEVELAATPLKGLQVEYNAGINDASYNKLQLSQNGQEVDLSGKKQLFTPAMTSMFAIQYNYSVASAQKIKLMIRGEWSYLGDQYFDLNNTIKQSGYSLLNTRIGIALKNVEVQFWARNLADQTYISYAYDFGAAHLGNPKNYGVTVKVSF
jgi:iron complex outermembrane receptor protein